MKTLKNIDIKNKKVIIRCDFNVPIKDGKIVDDTRILGSLKTIEYCLSQNAKIILLSHLGRVKEESDLAKNDLSPVAKRLTEYFIDIGYNVILGEFLLIQLLATSFLTL